MSLVKVVSRISTLPASLPYTVNHISLPVFSSAGLTDESCHMVLVEAKGEASDRWSDEHCRHGSCKNYCDPLHYGNVFEAMINSRIPG